MKRALSWTTIIEAMIAMFIIIVWTIWVYTIYEKSQKLSTSVENRVKAISIAREWIEVVQNIRDTNWVLFWADSKNCWNVLDYNVNCLWDTSITYRIPEWSYKIYKDENNRWKLLSGSILSWDYEDLSYRTEYQVKLDTNQLYTQSWWAASINPLFTREIKITYIDTNWSSGPTPIDEKMLVESIVSWSDNSKVWFYTVNLENILSNWKEY